MTTLKKLYLVLFTCVITILLFPAISAAQQAAGPVSLEEAVRAGIAMDLETKNYLLDTHSRAAAEAGARSAKGFSLDWSALYLYKSEQMEIVMPDMTPAPGVVIPGSRMTAGAKHNTDIKLALSQPLYTGGALSGAVKLQNLQGSIAGNLLLLSKIQAAAEIKTSYFTYRLLKSRLASLDVLLKQLELHQQRLQDFFREDLVRKSDLLETAAKIHEQTLNRRDLEQQLEQEKINFKALCGYDITAIEENYLETDMEFEQAQDYFNMHHPVLKSFAKRFSALGVNEELVKAKYLPHLGAFAEIHYGKPGIDFFANQWSFYFQGGFSIDMKLFDWNKKKQDLKVLNYELEKLENEKLDFVNGVNKGLQQLFTAKKSVLEKLSTLEQLVQIATEDSELKEQLLKEEQIANIDYLAALTQKERYISMRNTLKIQCELIKVNINLLSGKFETEEDSEK